MENTADRVIYDEECKEYKEGWNSCNSGASYFANPYSCVRYDGELYRLWQKGYNDCQSNWDDGDKQEPKMFSSSEIQSSFTITKIS
jgi:hypothetical protein